MKKDERAGCRCEKCKSACRSKPGWFLPGEAEKAAAYMGLSLTDFFETFLGVDFWESCLTSGYVQVLAPATLRGIPGEVYPDDPRGKCLLQAEDGSCRIYEARPHECREYFHDDDPEKVAVRHASVRDAWKDHQAQTTALLLGTGGA